MNRIDEIRARLDLAGTWSADGPDNAHFVAHAPSDIAWLLDREGRLISVLRVMTDLAEYDGGGIGRESLDEVLKDYGFSLDEIEVNKKNDLNG